MSGSVNKVILIGNLGKDPEIRTTQDGKEIANFSLATSESWKDKTTGERKEKTEWHRVVVFNPGIVKVIKDYVKKGSKLYIEGSLQTRKWEKDGVEHYSTEIVLQAFNGTLKLLDGKDKSDNQDMQKPDYNQNYNPSVNNPHRMNFVANLDDEIPF